MLPFWPFLPLSVGPRDFRLAAARLDLRPPRLRDRAAWCRMRRASRAFLEPWEPRWPADALSPAAYRRRYRQQVRDWAWGTGYSFFLWRRVDGALLGGLNLTNVRRGAAQAGTLGYYLAESQTGQGYMTEALARLLVFAFEDLALHRVDAACLPENEASQRLLERLGFECEGYARGLLQIDGAWRDHRLYGLTVESWAASDPAKELAGAGAG